MPTITSGKLSWPNLDAVINEARRVPFLEEQNKMLRHLIGAIASKGEMRVSRVSIDMHHQYEAYFDPITDDLILKVISEEAE